MSWIAKKANCLDRVGREFGVEALAEVLPQAWVREALDDWGIRTHRRRRLPCAMTVWLVILLALYRRHSYLNLLETLSGSRWVEGLWSDRLPPCSSALSKARDRVGVDPLARLYRRSASAWVESGGNLWFHGRRVCAIDGFTLKTWDSDENRSYFGVPGASRGVSAFPQLRVVGCIDIGTRVMEAVRFGPYGAGELTLADTLRPDLESGSLMLMDRHFASYGFLWDLHEQGVDFLVRVRRDMKAVILRELGPGDALVEISLPRDLRRRRPELPKKWILRQIRTTTSTGEPLRLFTTLRDPSIRANELADLYLRRWEEETAIDEIKTHLGNAATVNRPVILRSRKPRRVEQEIYGFLIAYNAVRRLMADAAACVDEPIPVSPLRLSFTAAVERIREAVRDMMRIPHCLLQDRYDHLIHAVGRNRVPERPGRSFPRAVRIKMSKYTLNRRRHVA